jgi:hypothetical protein
MNNLPYHDYQILKHKSPAEIELVSVPRRKIHLFLSQIGSDPVHLLNRNKIVQVREER